MTLLEEDRRIVPRCARCRTRVTSALVFREDGRYVVLARCHGEVESYGLSPGHSLEEAEEIVRGLRLFGGT